MVRLFISTKYTGGLRKENTGDTGRNIQGSSERNITGIWKKISKKDEVKGGGKSNFKIYKQLFFVKPTGKVAFTGFTW